MEITGLEFTEFLEQDFVVQINLNGFWEEFHVSAVNRWDALDNDEVIDRLRDTDYAPLVRPAMYKEFDNEKSFYLNGGTFACKCEAHQPEEDESEFEGSAVFEYVSSNAVVTITKDGVNPELTGQQAQQKFAVEMWERLTQLVQYPDEFHLDDVEVY